MQGTAWAGYGGSTLVVFSAKGGSEMKATVLGTSGEVECRVQQWQRGRFGEI